MSRGPGRIQRALEVIFDPKHISNEPIQLAICARLSMEMTKNGTGSPSSAP
jgi:hypothetical protein